MGSRLKGGCKRRAPGARQPCKLWQQRGGVLLRKCAARSSIFNKPSVCSKAKQKTYRPRPGDVGCGLQDVELRPQAASDVTRTRTTRLSAIYLHNVALARLAHACASSAEALDFGSKIKNGKNDNLNAAQAADVARPPAKLSQR